MKTQQTLKEALSKALLFQKSGKITQAIEIYETIIQEDNTCFDVYFNLGNCYKKNRDFKNALVYLKKAIKIDNKSYLCHFDIADVYNNLQKYEFCIFHLQKVIRICPDFYEAIYSMAQCYKKMKNETKMLEYLHKMLIMQPEHAGANHLLSSYNGDSTSEYSLEYARNLFDKYADHFEEHLISSLKYKLPFIIREKLKALNPPRNSKVLDLGCGTGLIGKTIIDLFPNLVGVDISANMIEETRKKDIYNELYINDVDAFLLKSLQVFDLIIAADVFIYIGNLQTIFSCVKKSLSINGYFIFTIEFSTRNGNEDFQLSKSRRFSHTMEYVESMCKDVGFEVIDKEEIVLRQENNIGQKGAIFILKLCSF